MQAHWRRRIGTAIGIAVVAVAAAVGPATVRAQSSIGSPVAANYKGAVGLGLIGAELGAVIPAVAGLDATWAYFVFPVIGAAGGAVGGYFAIDHAGHAELSVAALTLGMALVIPALVVTLAETAYNPESDGEGEAARTRRRQTARLTPADHARFRSARGAGNGLLRLAPGEIALAAPGVALLPSVERGELHLSGVNVALVSGRF
jgi:hypothetical protein